VKHRSSSFLKKRTNKLLLGCRGLAGDSHANVFASFFKKKRLLTCVVALATLTACGKVGPNQPPGPPDQIHWPKMYPTQ
jgi:hypothetical protein